jgi:integrase
MGVRRYTTKNGKFYELDEWIPLEDGSYHRYRKRRIPSKDLAMEMLRQVRAEAFSGTFVKRREQPKLTLRQLWEIYEPVSEQHNKSHRNSCNRAKHVLGVLGDRLVVDLTVADVEEYRRNRCAQKTHWKKPLAPSTLDREVALLKRMCNYAVETKLIPVNPLAGVPMLNVPNARDVTVSEDNFERLYRLAEPELKPILLTAYDTGMRRAEVLGLRWRQVDLEAGTIRLRGQDTKTSSPRLVVMTPRLIDELQGVPRQPGSEFVFVNPETKTAWHTVRKAFVRALKAADLEGTWFHDLRRSFVTNARRRGVPESVVMKMTGHKTRCVFDRYNIVNEDDLRDAVRRIEAGQKSGAK